MIENLYQIFAAPRPTSIEFCDHCVSPAQVEPFTTVPLRSLTPEHFGGYWLKSGTIGDENLERYLLPRFLELILTGEIDHFDADWYLGLVTRRCPQWTADERAAVGEYLRAYWSAGLAGEVGIDVEDVLARIAETGADLGPFLDSLEQRPELFADLVYGVERLDEPLRTWLLGPGPLAALERAALESPDPDGTLSNAHQVLEALRVR